MALDEVRINFSAPLFLLAFPSPPNLVGIPNAVAGEVCRSIEVALKDRYAKDWQKRPQTLPVPAAIRVVTIQSDIIDRFLTH